jgi:uncharacterized protein
MNIVLDTNVLVSGIFFRGPSPRIVQAWFRGRFNVYATPQIMEEYLRVIDEFSHKRQPHFEHDWDVVLFDKCHMISDPKKSCGICRDPADDPFIDCALQTDAQYLISGDLDLTSIEIDLGFAIVKPRQFLNIL